MLQTGTALHETGDDFDFALAPNQDLFALKKQGGGTNSTEIHVLSAASGYQQFILQTGTPLEPTDGNWAFAVAPNRDLFIIKKQGGGTNSTELHVLSAASNYQQFSLHTETRLHPIDDNWAFAIADNRDVFGIKKQGGGTSTTEVHVLSVASTYQAFGYRPARDFTRPEATLRLLSLPGGTCSLSRRTQQARILRKSTSWIFRNRETTEVLSRRTVVVCSNVACVFLPWFLASLI